MAEERRGTLTAYVTENDQVLIYDDSRGKPGDPCVIVDKDCWIDLARFLLDAHQSDVFVVGEDINLYGNVGELTDEV